MLNLNIVSDSIRRGYRSPSTLVGAAIIIALGVILLWIVAAASNPLPH